MSQRYNARDGGREGGMECVSARDVEASRTKTKKMRGEGKRGMDG